MCQTVVSTRPTRSSWVLSSSTSNPESGSQVESSNKTISDISKQHKEFVNKKWKHDLKVKIALQLAAEVADVHHVHRELLLLTLLLLLLPRQLEGYVVLVHNRSSSHAVAADTGLIN